MSQKPIREYSGKRLIQAWMEKHGVIKEYKTIKEMLLITPEKDLKTVERVFSEDTLLVAKPDQLVKRRGKLGLIELKVPFDKAIEWVGKVRGRELQIGNSVDCLNYFLIEPFLPHEASEEHYLCIHSIRDGDEIMFYHEGGVDVGDVDSKALRLLVNPATRPNKQSITDTLLLNIADEKKKEFIAEFIFTLYHLYTELHFAYLEINPLVVKNDLSGVYILDLAAMLDSTAEFQCHSQWSRIVDFPPFFGHRSSPEEKFIQELDERTGASLKLTILNPKARVWTMVAGGGASVIYADTICDIGFADELGNYGEYSGAPTKELTHQYASTIIKLMCRYPHPKGKVFLIGGGIANFTDVADTFKGVVQALQEYKEDLKKNNTKIFVRRGGPNYQTGLKIIKKCADDCGLDMQVFGPETHVTAIVSMALSDDKDPKARESLADANCEAFIDSVDLKKYKWNETWEDGDTNTTTTTTTTTNNNNNNKDEVKEASTDGTLATTNTNEKPNKSHYVMTNETRAIVFGMQVQAVQNMLDFDYICQRKKPSVAAIVYGFASGTQHQQCYWGSKEVMIPVFRTLKDALEKYPEVDTVVNFASSRSAYDATLEMLTFSQIKHITIIAEGVPERYTRHLTALSKEKNVTILGPSTVGGVKPGCFRIGNTGGMLDNIIACKLHRPGSVGFVSRSGGLSNELANIISRCSDGVCEGMAIGGDRYPCSTFMDNLLRYQRDPNCRILVLLGEVGGTLEYEVVEAIKSKKITKPLIAWCTGTCAKQFKHDVQFGHAGAMAQSQKETAAIKNETLAKAGALVPESFDDFGRYIKFLYQRLLREKIIREFKEVEPPPVPVDYAWARKLGLIRKPSGFISGISDERGEELVYAGMPISQIFEEQLGVGGVVSLLWFRRRLPDYCNKFIELVLMVTADHGPAVSGAHNTIVTARAGKDLISSLCSGLLTIGPRFGGALDGAAQQFTKAYDEGLSAVQFVQTMRDKGEFIMGIGHKVKSLENPDKRVELVVGFAKENIPSTPVLDYALEVQKVTVRKKSNLILNVDGAIACAFVDLLRNCKAFSRQEANDFIEMGTLNALFVLGRSIGFIGHFIDQKRLNQGLYRHPTDDITYFLHDLPNAQL